MTVYNCGPIYYTFCFLCLAFSLHCANLSYRIMLFVLVSLCVFLISNYLAAVAFLFLIKVSSLF